MIAAQSIANSSLTILQLSSTIIYPTPTIVPNNLQTGNDKPTQLKPSEPADQWEGHATDFMHQSMKTRKVESLITKEPSVKKKKKIPISEAQRNIPRHKKHISRRKANYLLKEKLIKMQNHSSRMPTWVVRWRYNFLHFMNQLINPRKVQLFSVNEPLERKRRKAPYERPTISVTPSTKPTIAPIVSTLTSAIPGSSKETPISIPMPAKTKSADSLATTSDIDHFPSIEPSSIIIAKPTQVHTASKKIMESNSFKMISDISCSSKIKQTIIRTSRILPAAIPTTKPSSNRFSFSLLYYWGGIAIAAFTAIMSTVIAIYHYIGKRRLRKRLNDTIECYYDNRSRRYLQEISVSN